jgi:hypothetical protein
MTQNTYCCNAAVVEAGKGIQNKSPKTNSGGAHGEAEMVK